MSECLLMHVQLWELPRDSVTNRLCHYSLIFFFYWCMTKDVFTDASWELHKDSITNRPCQYSPNVFNDTCTIMRTTQRQHHRLCHYCLNVQLWELPKDSITGYVVAAWMSLLMHVRLWQLPKDSIRLCHYCLNVFTDAHTTMRAN